MVLLCPHYLFFTPPKPLRYGHRPDRAPAIPGRRRVPAMTRQPYPPARRDDVVDDLHGTPVPDPYRWLEDPDDPATKEWLSAQETLFTAGTAALPGRERFRARVAELLKSGSVGAPVWRGERRMFMRRTPSRSTPCSTPSTPAAPSGRCWTRWRSTRPG
nr:hypothetical protein GCM10020093_048300 [Planobispora longispora]